MHSAAWRQEIEDDERQIDLAQLIKEVLDGAVGDQPMTEIQTMDGACRAVERVLVAKIGRPIGPSERTRLLTQTAVEFVARREKAKRDAAETQVVLASPLSVFSR